MTVDWTAVGVIAPIGVVAAGGLMKWVGSDFKRWLQFQTLPLLREIRGEMANMRAELAQVADKVASHDVRIARIEGRQEGRKDAVREQVASKTHPPPAEGL